MIKYTIAFTFLLQQSTFALLPYIQPKAENHCLSREFLEALTNHISIKNFIETGTFAGGTTLAAAPLFPIIHTVELDRELFLQARQLLAPYSHIHLHQGDSGELLKKIIPSLAGRTLFWLDAHYSGAGTAFAGCGTPILEELEAIKTIGNSPCPLIFVDDVRLFDFISDHLESNSGQTFPDLAQIVTKLFAINPNFSFALLGDTLLAFDPSVNLQLSPVAQACTKSRLARCLNIDDTEIEREEQQIYLCQGIEKDTFAALHAVFCHPESDTPSPYYHIWYGLTLMREKLYNHAIQQFERAIELGYDAPRIQRYLQACRNYTARLILAAKNIFKAHPKKKAS